MAAVLLAAGAKSKRYILPHSRVMIHQPWGGVQGQASDIEIHAKEILKSRSLLNKILSDTTGQKLSKIEKDTDRNFFLGAEESVKYGLVDKVMVRSKELKKSKAEDN